MILNVRLLSSVCDRTLGFYFYLKHAKLGKEDDVILPFLKNGEKEKLPLSFRGFSAENSTQDIFRLRLSYAYMGSPYVVIFLYVGKLTV